MTGVRRARVALLCLPVTSLLAAGRTTRLTTDYRLLTTDY